MESWRNWLPFRQARVRPVAVLSLALLMGMLAAWRWRPQTAACYLACGGAAVIAAVCIACRRGVMAALLALCACIGLARMSAAIGAVPPVRETRYSVKMVGEVAAEPWLKPETGRLIFPFRLSTVNGQPESGTVRLYLRGDAGALAQIDYGQTLSVSGHIWKNDPVTNPFEFDFAGWLHRNGMRAIATAKVEQAEVLSSRRDVHSFLIAARRAIGARIDKLFPRSAGLVRALILGDRSMLGEETRAALSATGIAHLIAISGLHVTVMAMAVSLLLGRFIPRKWARLVTLVPLLLYGALIGFTAPFVRALVMYALLCLGRLAGEPPDPVTRLCLAMAVWLMISPMTLTDGGFVLSFAASAGIILLLNPLLRLTHLDQVLETKVQWHSWRRMARQLAVYFVTLLCASLAAQLATLPAVVAMFGVQSVVSLPFNLVCVPLCMIGYILAAACVVLSAPLLALARLLAVVPDGLLALLTGIARSSQALPVTAVHIARYPVALVALHAVLLVMASDLCALRWKIRRWLSLSLAAVAGLSCLIAFLNAWPFSVTVLDAEQANCAVVTTQGRTYVVDAGDTYTPVSDYLTATCLHLDGVFLSHPHEDHAGGLLDLLAAFRPDVIYVPEGWYACKEVADSIQAGMERAKALAIPVVAISAGDAVELSGAVRMNVYNPAPGALPEEVNDLSLVLHATDGEHSALFTGDVTMGGEPPNLPDCDILHVPHHGADNATSPGLLAATAPEIAVISVGENNFGHPGDAALARLGASGAKLLRTDRAGAIRLTLRDGTWRVQTYLEDPDGLE